VYEITGQRVNICIRFSRNERKMREGDSMLIGWQEVTSKEKAAAAAHHDG